MAAGAANRPGTRFLAIFGVTWFAVLATAALVFVTVVVPQARRRARAEMARELGLLEDVRVSAIRAWCQDALADARTVAGFPTSRVLVSARPEYAADPHFGSILDEYARLHSVDHLTLLDAKGRVCASTTRAFAMSDEVQRLVLSAVAGGRDTIDFARDATGRAYVMVVARTPAGDGALIASHNPGAWIYSLLSSSPRGLAASEAVLLRKEGDDYRLLSPAGRGRLRPLELLPRRGDGTSVYDSGEGFVEGRDESGGRVMAESRTIAGPEWRLVCKVDAASAFARVNSGLPLLAMQTALLLTALTALAFALVWGQRRSLEADAARKRERLAVLLDQANEAMGYLTPDGRVAHANRSAEEFYGVPGGMVGKTVAEVMRAPGAGPARAAVEAEMRRAGRMTFETEHVAAAGLRVPVEVSMRAVTIEGEPYHVFVVRDLRQRREDEAQIRRLNRLLRATTAVGMALSRVRDESELFERTCRIMVDTGGFRMASVVMRTGEDRFESVHLETGGAFLHEQLGGLRAGLRGHVDPSADAIRSGRSLRVGDLAQRGAASGAEVPAATATVRSSGTGLIEVNGLVRGALTIFEPEVDAFDDEAMALIESVAAEIGATLGALEARRAHAKLEQRLAALFATGPVGLVVADAGGIVTHANAEFLRMAGRSASELASGRIDWAACCPGAAAVVAGESGAPAPFESELHRPGGAPLPVLIGCMRLVDADRETIAVVSDLTRLREAAESLRAAQAQLIQSQKMEMIGQLAGGVAHDFNNLLTVIHGYAEMLRARLGQDEDGREQAHQILRAAERASGLTRQLLAFSRRQVLDPRDVDLRLLVRDVEQMLQRLIGSRVRLRCDLPATLERVRVDPGSIEQVIVNLVVNARDAMPEGGHIVIALANETIDEAEAAKRPPLVPGRYARLSVSDDGSGMDAHVLPHIFEPFFTTKEKGKGTGLGLATVYGIVKQSGGYIFAESRVGEGSTFDVLLPCLATENAPVPARSPGGPLAHPGPAS